MVTLGTQVLSGHRLGNGKVTGKKTGCTVITALRNIHGHDDDKRTGTLVRHPLAITMATHLLSDCQTDNRMEQLSGYILHEQIADRQDRSDKSTNYSCQEEVFLQGGAQ